MGLEAEVEVRALDGEAGKGANGRPDKGGDASASDVGDVDAARHAHVDNELELRPQHLEALDVERRGLGGGEGGEEGVGGGYGARERNNGGRMGRRKPRRRSWGRCRVVGEAREVAARSQGVGSAHGVPPREGGRSGGGRLARSRHDDGSERIRGLVQPHCVARREASADGEDRAPDGAQMRAPRVRRSHGLEDHERRRRCGGTLGGVARLTGPAEDDGEVVFAGVCGRVVDLRGGRGRG